MGVTCCVYFFLYPSLITLGLFSVLIGCIHFLICQPFYFVLPGLVNGILILVASFHGIFLTYPNRCCYLLQVSVIVFSMYLLSICVLELICVDLSPFIGVNYSSDSLCSSLRLRTEHLVTPCHSTFEFVHQNYLPCLNCDAKEHLNVTVAERDVGVIVSGSLSIIALLQLLLSCLTTWFAAYESEVQVQAHHLQMFLSIITILFGLVHTFYCCTYFYAAFGVWAGALILLQAVITAKANCKGVISRAVNVVGAGLGMSLMAVNAFAVFCWRVLYTDPLMHKRQCVWNQSKYDECERRIWFSVVYKNVPESVFKSEYKMAQIVSCVALIVCGFWQFMFSLRSAFKRKSRY